MGTRGLIRVLDSETKQPIVTIYRQYDCYPEGLGLELKALLGKSTIVNGYGTTMAAPKVFNGEGCMAAFLIKSLKENIGNVYIMPPNTSDVGEEYIYNLYVYKDKIHITAMDCDLNVLYDGPISKWEVS